MTNLLRTLCSTATALFCSHEWVKRREPGRVYLECMHCLSTTHGIEVQPKRPLPVLVRRASDAPSDRRSRTGDLPSAG